MRSCGSGLKRGAADLQVACNSFMILSSMISVPPLRMKTKFNLIAVTVVCTTFGWVLIIGGLLTLSFKLSKVDTVAMVRLPNPGDPSLAEWRSQQGEFIIRLVSSNITTSSTSVLFSCTSRAPERIWFETFKKQPGLYPGSSAP